MKAWRVGLLAAGAVGAAVERRLRTCPDMRLVSPAHEGVDVVVDACDDDSSLPTVHQALARGVTVVAANATALAAAGPDLEAVALASGAQLLVDPALGGPSPRRVVRELAERGGVASIEGTLDGGAGAAIEALASGRAAVDVAPSTLHGTAAADALAVVAAAAFVRPIRRQAVDVMGLDWLTEADGDRARQEGRRWALVARATGACARVEPTLVALDNPLAAGSRTLVVVGTDGTRVVLRLGRGGPEAVAAAVVSQLRETAVSPLFITP